MLKSVLMDPRTRFLPQSRYEAMAQFVRDNLGELMVYNPAHTITLDVWDDVVTGAYFSSTYPRRPDDAVSHLGTIRSGDIMMFVELSDDFHRKCRVFVPSTGLLGWTDLDFSYFAPSAWQRVTL